MLVYSIFFGLLSISFVQNNFENGYLLIFCLWSTAYYVLVFLGNLLYSFNCITPKLRTIWKVVFPVVILQFLSSGIVDVIYGPHVHKHGVIATTVSYLFAFLLFYPTFKAHYVIGYGKELKEVTRRNNILPAASAILSFCILGLLGLRFLVLGRFTLPSDAEYEAIAKNGQPVAQAIFDYHSEHGLLPLELSDVVPMYLANAPEPAWRFDGVMLLHNAGIPRSYVSYSFVGEEGWSVWGEGIDKHRLNVAGPVGQKPALTGEALFNAQLAEYERRISHHPDNSYYNERIKEFYGDKIRFVGLAKRQDLLRAECERDAKIFPDWWLPQMALAESDELNTDAERQFVAWVRQHSTYANYWYLARYYRDKGDKRAALAALEQAAGSLYEQYPEGGQWSGPAYAFDAAQFSYENGEYDLTLKLCQPCEQDEDVLGFVAAAQLKLMRFESAITNAQRVVDIWEQYQWPPHVQESALLEASKSHDTNFMYRPEKYVKYYTNTQWVLFFKPSP